MSDLFSRFNVITQSQHDAEAAKAPAPAVARGSSSLFSRCHKITTIPDDDPYSKVSLSSSSGRKVETTGSSSGWLSRRSIDDLEEYQDMLKMKKIRELSTARDESRSKNMSTLKNGCHVWTKDPEIAELSKKKGPKAKRRH